MKAHGSSTTLEDIEQLLIEASRLTNHRHFVIGGSLCAIGAVMKPPPAMVMSRDVDLYPKFDPERGFHEIAQQLSAESPFFQEHGIYADAISPRLLSLPQGWESRLLQIPLKGGVVAWFIEPNDAAIGKLMRGEEHDLRWVEAGVSEGILHLDTIEARLKQTNNALNEDYDNARRNIASLRRSTSSTPSPRPT